MTVKDNNPELRAQIESAIKAVVEHHPELLYTHTTTDKAHGRLEERAIEVVDISGCNVGIPGIRQVARVKRRREVLATGKQPQEEEINLVTNMPFEQADAERLLWLNRHYWLIENRLHYAKDFVFGEDRSTIRVGHGPQNMASLRNFAIGLMLSNGITNIKRCVENLRHNPKQLFRFAA